MTEFTSLSVEENDLITKLRCTLIDIVHHIFFWNWATVNMKVGVFTSNQRIRDLDSSLVIRALEIEAHSFKAGVQMTLISHCRWLFLTVIHFPKDILFFYSHNEKHYKGLGTQSEWFSVMIVSWHPYLITLKILIHMPFLLLQSVRSFNENVAIQFTKRPWK